MSYITYEVTVSDSGDRIWRLDGKLHRTDGPAAEYANGDKWWYKNGQIHREGGPATEHANGARMWCQEGQMHRTDGPALVRADGTKEWHLDGKKLTEAEYNARTKPSCSGKVVEIDGKKYTLAEIV